MWRCAGILPAVKFTDGNWRGWHLCSDKNWRCAPGDCRNNSGMFLYLQHVVVHCEGIVRPPSEEYSTNHLCFYSQDGRIFVWHLLLVYNLTNNNLGNHPNLGMYFVYMHMFRIGDQLILIRLVTDFIRHALPNSNVSLS